LPIEALLLDSGPLSQITHPRQNPAFAGWLGRIIDAGIRVLIPEIADYEVRRELLRAGKLQGVARLDSLAMTLTYLPITTETMRKAASLWAQSRNKGLPTAAPRELDGDVILAAQALLVEGVVVTENLGHLSRFVEVQSWQNWEFHPNRGNGSHQ
jgi:predicted nucleic acid-binding protein